MLENSTGSPTFALLGQLEIPSLIVQIKEIMRENKTHNLPLFNEEAWLWQYKNLPGETSKVFVVKYNNKIAGYYHVPIYDAIVNGEAKRMAMVQLVAVSPALRGCGIFKQLTEFVHANLLQLDIDFICTFPNKRSIQTFIKYNQYKLIATCGLYILPVKASRIIRSKIKILGLEKSLGVLIDKTFNLFSRKMPAGYSVNQLPGFSPALTEVYRRFQQLHTVNLNRTGEYLTWRFVENPLYKHYIISINNDGIIEAVAVFKTDAILGNRTLILMDFAFLPGKSKSLLYLINEVKGHPQKYIPEEFNLIFASGLSRFFGELRKIGFLCIPGKLSPRPLNFLVKNNAVEPSEIVYNPKNWHVTLADWDVL